MAIDRSIWENGIVGRSALARVICWRVLRTSWRKGGKVIFVNFVKAINNSSLSNPKYYLELSTPEWCYSNNLSSCNNHRGSNQNSWIFFEWNFLKTQIDQELWILFDELGHFGCRLLNFSQMLERAPHRVVWKHHPLVEEEGDVVRRRLHH